ncbi:hypothetical protein LCGC14_1762050 [marine sediment metagenome]|uniref:Uncharacterized protein n=1 Tax=marine sediment metagenome TaxID=412755 RepID=A0A0F9K0C4_9ZZZZ
MKLKRYNKIPSTEEIIEEAESLKICMNTQDFQLGMGEVVERQFKNRLNKIIRMLKCPMRKVDIRKLTKQD